MELIFNCKTLNLVIPSYYLVAAAVPVPLAFPEGYPHFDGACHTPFPPAVFSETPLVGQSCGRQVHLVPLSDFRRKEVW